MRTTFAYHELPLEETPVIADVRTFSSRRGDTNFGVTVYPTLGRARAAMKLPYFVLRPVKSPRREPRVERIRKRNMIVTYDRDGRIDRRRLQAVLHDLG